MEERDSRVDIEHDWYDLFEREVGYRQLTIERCQVAALKKERRQESCDVKYGRYMSWSEQRDDVNEDWFREDGKRLLQESRDWDIQHAIRQQERRRQMRADMEGFKAAAAFIEGDETRNRQSISQSFELFLKQARQDIARKEKDLLQDVEDAKLRVVRERQEQEAAASAAMDAARMKHEDKVKKEQQRLMNRCTHSKNGKSVFLGPFAKKTCLMCKVKVDPVSGLLVSTDRH